MTAPLPIARPADGPPPRFSPAYARLDEAQIADLLAVYSWPSDAARGDTAAVRARAARSLRAWEAQGLGWVEAGGRRRYDPVQVQNFRNWAGLRFGDPAFLANLDAVRRQTEQFRAAVEGGTGVHGPRRFVVHLRREFNLRRHADRPVRLRLPAPYEDATQTDVSVSLVSTPEGTLAADLGPPRIEVRLAPGRYDVVAVEARYELTAWCQRFPVDGSVLEPPRADDEEPALYTRATEGLIRVTPALSALAARLSAASRTPWDAVAAFWEFQLSRQCPGYVHYDEVDPDDPLRLVTAEGWYDCRIGSSYLAALCRARGIPARVVQGLPLYAPPPPPSIHHWVEVLLPPYGWVPVDVGPSWACAGGDPSDARWARYFLGALDYRMKLECLPRVFVGPSTVSLPRAWYHTDRLGPDGRVVGYFAAGGDELLYRDRLTVQAA